MTNILIFIGAIVLLIIIHEFGHFIASKLFGVEVEEFGLGFPPRALGFWRSKGFLLFNRKRIEIPQNFGRVFDWQALVHQSAKVTVDQVDQRYVLRTVEFIEEETGSRSPMVSGEQIVVDAQGRMVESEQAAPSSKTVTLGTQRGMIEWDGVVNEVHPGTLFSLNWLPLGGFVRPKGENDPTVPGGLAAANPWVRIVVFAAGPLANFLAAIILFALIFTRVGVPDVSQTLVVQVVDGSPAAAAGLQPGDILTMLNDVTITGPEILQAEVARNLGKETLITYQRGDQVLQTTLIPRENPPDGQGAMGIEYSHPTVKAGPIQAIGMGSVALYDQVMQILTMPGRLIQGTIAPGQARLVGFKGMFDIYQKVRGADAEVAVQEEPAAGLNTLYFFASISLSLGLINLFPIPALDGGHILFTLPEIIFRKRIPRNAENIINAVSFVMLLLLLIYVNVQDFINPLEF